MNFRKVALTMLFVLVLPGCTAIPFGIGLIPGAPAYVSSLLDNGPMAYETAMDERSTRQQMLDSVVAGHAQAELYRHKEIRPLQITTYCYFGKLYLVGEYDSQEQLKTIYECMDKVEGKTDIVSRLYLKESQSGTDYLQEQATWANLKAQLMADLEVTSATLDVEVVQGDIILLGVVSDEKERKCIETHARAAAGKGAVVSYLYHQEISGPAPRPLAELPEPEPKRKTVALAEKPKKKKRKITKKRTPTPRKDVAKTAKPEPAKQAVAANIPSAPLLVNGRYQGL